MFKSTIAIDLSLKDVQSVVTSILTEFQKRAGLEINSVFGNKEHIEYVFIDKEGTQFFVNFYQKKDKKYVFELKSEEPLLKIMEKESFFIESLNKYNNDRLDLTNQNYIIGEDSPRESSPEKC